MSSESIFVGVDLHCESNNKYHHTSEISVDRLIVRRGQPFKLTINLRQPFDRMRQSLVITAKTGNHAKEDRGTLSFFGIPDVNRSRNAKAVWKVELIASSLWTGTVVLSITPPADAPIGEFTLGGKYMGEEKELVKLVVLYNPWCSDDWVYMMDKTEITEYVMNEHGVIFRGSYNYIAPLYWDFGQFEENMVDICLKVLDLNRNNLDDPEDDVAARCDPIYVGRVVSAMINCQDDKGVLEGRWDGSYGSGFSPTHWVSSYAILKRWYNNSFNRVQYGQCWVFAGVMCSVMRLLGIPCRVVSNFRSAHDCNMNLTIDVYHADYGVRERPSRDSIWNYHVWVEAWMRRPDLSADGKYDGWQVLDPTPQEMSEGVYCCGPAPVKAILQGETAFKYDIPFVFAEVNADCIDWLVKADNSLEKLNSDTKKVGCNISTKMIGSDRRLDVTNKYKYREETYWERFIFNYASTRDYSNPDEDEEEDETEEGADVEETTEVVDETTGSPEIGIPEIGPPINGPPPPPVTVKFISVTKPTNGKDVRLKLQMTSKSVTSRTLSINISVQAMRYNGRPTMNIQNEVLERVLKPATALSIPIRIRFKDYHKAMVDSDSIKIEVKVTDKDKPDETYLAEDDIVLLDPPISVKVDGVVRKYREAEGEVIFMNPTTDETLTNCMLTICGSGLIYDDCEWKIPDLRPFNRTCVRFSFYPYKAGQKTLEVVFDCSTFKGIKCHCTINVKDSF